MAFAALEKVRTELQCPICFNLFTNPVTLACGHSFCLDCLNGYVRAHPTAVFRRVLPCSVCRQETKVPDPEQPIENWGKQLTPAFALRNLADEIRTTPSTSEGELTDKSKSEKTVTVLCPDHNKRLKFYCLECSRSVCSSCCTLGHRKCDNIVSFESVLPQMESVIAESHQSILKSLKDKELEVTSLKSRLEFVESDEKRTLSKIDDDENRKMILLRENCKKEKDEVRKTAQSEKSDLETAIKAAQQDVRRGRENAEILSQTLESGDVNKILQKDRESTNKNHVMISDLDFRYLEDTLRIETGIWDLDLDDRYLQRYKWILDTGSDSDSEFDLGDKLVLF